MPGISRIDTAFSELARKGECALVCYAVAGYPDLRTSQVIIETLAREGADVVEIGIPFSDPIADGPTIQAASQAALEKGIRPDDALELASRIRAKFPALPLLVMTYSNILARHGFGNFVEKARASGIDGFIIPDLPVEEAGEYVRACRDSGISTVFMASPNTPRDRLARIIAATRGFLYVVSVFGITGARRGFEDYTRSAVREIKSAAGPNVPVAAGFGISKPDHVRFMRSAGADGVIIGSAIVDIISKSHKNRTKLVKELGRYVRSIKSACREIEKVH